MITILGKPFLVPSSTQERIKCQYAWLFSWPWILPQYGEWPVWQTLTPHHYHHRHHHHHTWTPHNGSHDEIGTACACHDHMQPIFKFAKINSMPCEGRIEARSDVKLNSVEIRRESSNVMKQLILARRANVLNAGRTSLSSQRRPATSAQSGKPSLIKFGTDLAFRHLVFRMASNMWENEPLFSTKILVVRPLWSTKSCLTNTNFTFDYISCASSSDLWSNLQLEKHECCSACVCGI